MYPSLSELMKGEELEDEVYDTKTTLSLGQVSFCDF